MSGLLEIVGILGLIVAVWFGLVGWTLFRNPARIFGTE